jgi:peptide/nickel transport system permease protein
MTPMTAPPRRRRPSAGVIGGGAFLVTLVVLSVLAAHLSFVRGVNQGVRVHGRLQSNYRQGPGWLAWWGTDGTGNDVFARCITYARNSLQIGLTATALGLMIGGAFGLVAGYFRGWVDRVISIVIDCLLSIPALVLAILLISRLDSIKVTYTWLGWLTRKEQIIFSLSILAIAPLARIVRAQTLSLREREFVTAARSSGATDSRIIVREILPNLVPTMVTVAFTGLGILIAAEGSLAFLGLGIHDSWGKMIEDNRNDISSAWWATVFPCLMLFLTVLSFNLIGDRLARRFDIREAGV